jgi:hypothetical protein
LIEPFDLNLPIIEEKRSIHFIKNKIHEVYKQIKKNRQTNNNNDTEEYDTIENECVVDSSAEEQDSTPLWHICTFKMPIIFQYSAKGRILNI